MGRYKHSLVIAACFQNDASYLREWIEFHRLIGFGKFYLFDNLSTDGFLEILKPYIHENIVELTSWPIDSTLMRDWTTIQSIAYERALDRAKNKVKWLALIDTDEFLFSPLQSSLETVLQSYEKFGGVAINWQVYGTSKVLKIPNDRLMVELLTWKAAGDNEVNFHVKSIVRPECVEGCENPHCVVYKPGYYQVDENQIPFEGPFSAKVRVEKLRINHYMVRDGDYLIRYKIPRRKKWRSLPEEGEVYYDSLNHVEDRLMDRFIPQLKEKMRY